MHVEKKKKHNLISITIKLKNSVVYHFKTEDLTPTWKGKPLQIETLIASLWLLWRKPLQPFSQPEKRKELYHPTAPAYLADDEMV